MPKCHKKLDEFSLRNKTNSVCVNSARKMKRKKQQFFSNEYMTFEHGKHQALEKHANQSPSFINYYLGR